MDDADKTVFISYRRDVSSFIARAIFMDLRQHGYDVFMDVETIDSGEFDTILLNQIAARAHFLLILTPGTLERCNEPNDWLRREIEEAIRVKRNIVPVLVNDFRMKEAEAHLTGELDQLKRMNALNLPHEYFDAAMEKLRNRFLKQPVYGAITPASLAEEKIVIEKIKETASQPSPTEEQLSAEEYFVRGNSAYNAGEFLAAITSYSHTIELNPTESAAYNNRAEAHFMCQAYLAALEDFQQANEMQYKDNRLGGIAIAHHALGNEAEAKRLWGELLENDARYGDPEWVETELKWAEPLVEEARKLIAKL